MCPPSIPEFSVKVELAAPVPAPVQQDLQYALFPATIWEWKSDPLTMIQSGEQKSANPSRLEQS
jgi:hypothetical protein